MAVAVALLDRLGIGDVRAPAGQAQNVPQLCREVVAGERNIDQEQPHRVQLDLGIGRGLVVELLQPGREGIGAKLGEHTGAASADGGVMTFTSSSVAAGLRVLASSSS